MADLALERHLLIDDSFKTSAGDKIFKILPWYAVVYTDGGSEKIAGLEPHSVGLGNATKDNGSDIQVRGIEFLREGTMLTRYQTAGHVGLPIA